jgi:mannose-6-phosphate isomerase-like protein (cupin superfamily)
MEQRSQGPRILGPNDGKTVDFGSFGVRFMVWSEESGGGFSLVEHPIPPWTLVARLHRHANEDEYSYILEGRMGAQLGDKVVHAEKGDFVFKPRDQWHIFWNAGDEPLRILEIISPGGFEHLFEEKWLMILRQWLVRRPRRSMPGTAWRSITKAWSASAKSMGSTSPLRNEVARENSKPTSGAIAAM